MSFLSTRLYLVRGGGSSMRCFAGQVYARSTFHSLARSNVMLGDVLRTQRTLSLTKRVVPEGTLRFQSLNSLHVHLRCGRSTSPPLSVRFVCSTPPSLAKKEDSEKSDTASTALSQEDISKLSKWERMKWMWKNYGIVFLVYWTGMWAVSLAGVWGAIELAEVDPIALLKRMGSDHIYDVSGWNPKLINFLLAVEINELGEIIRLPFAISTTPAVAKWWRSKRSASA